MKHSLRLTAVALVTALSASSARAGVVTTIYDSIGPGTTGETYFTASANDQYAYDDLHVAGGGAIDTIRFAYGTEFFGGQATGDAHVVLYLDDGATSPGSLDTAEDTLLFSDNLRGIQAFTGNFGQVTYRVGEFGFHDPSIIIPDNATVFAGVSFTRISGGSLHAVYFAPITVGSSDLFAYPEGGTPVNSIDFGLPENNSLGWEIDVVPVPEPMTLSLLAIGGIALIRRRR